MKPLYLFNTNYLWIFFVFFNNKYAFANNIISILSPTNTPIAISLLNHKIRIEHYSHPLDLQFKIKQDPQRWDGVICYADEAKEMEQVGKYIVFQEIYELYPDPYVLFWHLEKKNFTFQTWSQLIDKNYIAMWRQKLTFVGPDKLLALFSLLEDNDEPENWVRIFLKNKSQIQKKFPLNILQKGALVGISPLSQILIHHWLLKNVSFTIPNDKTWYRQIVLAVPSSSKRKLEIEAIKKAILHTDIMKKLGLNNTPNTKWKAWPNSFDEIWEKVEKVYDSAYREI